jgi:hypothetical protein
MSILLKKIETGFSKRLKKNMQVIKNWKNRGNFFRNKEYVIPNKFKNI